MSAPNQDGPTPLEITNEGGTIIVPDKQGNPREVFLRILPMGAYKEYAGICLDEEKAVDFLAKSPGLSATLPPASVGTLIEEGERMNADFFPWCQRGIRRLARTGTAPKSALPPGTSTSQASASVTG